MAFRSFDLVNLVKNHGSAMVLRRMAIPGIYNPATGSVDNSFTADVNIRGYFFDFAVGLLQGENLSHVTTRCVIPARALTHEPTDKDLIVGNGNTYAISTVTVMYNDGQAICYICGIKE